MLKSDVIKVELGSEPDASPSGYINLDAEDANLAAIDFSAVDFMTVGIYTATATYQAQSKTFDVVVQDTTAPAATAAAEVRTVPGVPLYAEDILTGVTELSKEVTVSYQENEEPAKKEAVLEGTETVLDAKGAAEMESFLLDGVVCNNVKLIYSESGEYENVMILTDASGNETKIPFHIIVGMPPILEGVGDITVPVGTERVDFLLGITASDGKGTDITDKIVCDTSAVQPEKAGKYEITYTVTDEEGFQTVERAAVIVSDEITGKSGTIKDKRAVTGNAGKRGMSERAASGSASSKNSSTGVQKTSGTGNTAGNNDISGNKDTKADTDTSNKSSTSNNSSSSNHSSSSKDSSASNKGSSSNNGSASKDSSASDHGGASGNGGASDHGSAPDNGTGTNENNTPENADAGNKEENPWEGNHGNGTGGGVAPEDTVHVEITNDNGETITGDVPSDWFNEDGTVKE